MILSDSPMIYDKEGVYRGHGRLLAALGFFAGQEESHLAMPVISIVGAGGKTHTFYRLDQELTEMNISHFLMTTTHMRLPKEKSIHSKLPEDISARRDGWWMGQPSKKDPAKLAPPGESVMAAVCASGYPVVIEADGARGKSCKVPATWEPAIRQETTWVIGIMGLTAIGQRICESCHRPEDVARFLGKEPEDTLTWQDMCRIIDHPDGLFKSAGDRKKVLILNQADDKICRTWGRKIVSQATIPGLTIWMTSYRKG